MKKAIFAGIVLGLTLMTTNVYAQGSVYRSFIDTLLESNIKTWLLDAEVIESIKAQNIKHASLQQGEVLDLDNQWRAERKEKERPMIEAVLANPLSTLLKEIKAKNGNLFSEIFVMDNKGLNVGQSDVTSDYWQGDEDKWQQTYLSGPEALFIDNREFDDSSGKFLIQVSIAIADPDTQEAIGAATIGLNLVELMRTSVANLTSQ